MIEASDVECCLFMEEFLDDVLSVLAECPQLTDHSDIHAIDKSVLSLKSVCRQLNALLNEATVTGDWITRKMNQILFESLSLCLEYETKLVFLLLTYGRRGRPKKIINLAMVRICI